jgi:hypothetical protein
MGLLDVYAAQANTGVTTPLTSLPSDASERFGAAWDEQFAPDRYFNLQSSRRDWYEKINDQLHANTGQPPLPYPGDPVTHEELDQMQGNVDVAAIQQARQQKFIDVTRAASQEFPDTILAENIDAYIGQAGDRARQKANDYVGTGNGLAAFAGGALAPTPENLLGFLIPPSRALGGAVAVGRSFLADLGREALYQGAANAGLTAAAQGADVLSRSQTGTAPTAGEVAGNIAMAGVGGAALGGAFHSLHMGSTALFDHWNGLSQAARDAAPQEVRDAFQTIGTDALYQYMNRLGIDPLLHERYQGNALDAVMRGRPVSFDELQPHDTPMTGLATIMSQPTDKVSLDGITTALNRVQALPDSEIESFARQATPNSFARIDKIDAQLTDLHGQIADMDSRTPSIHDLVDPDTSLRLQDIESDLAKPALAKQQRTALEQERDMIVSTVDPADQLPKQAEKTQAKARAGLQAQVDKLAAQRVEAAATAKGATDDLRTKLDRYAGAPGFEPKAAIEDLGFKEPADFADALQRADLMRQARILREHVQPGQPSPAAPVDLKVNTPVPETPPDIDVSGMMKGKTASEHRKALMAELDGHDADVKDAQALAKCAAGGTE